jgi:hypothetical protein
MAKHSKNALGPDLSEPLAQGAPTAPPRVNDGGRIAHHVDYGRRTEPTASVTLSMNSAHPANAMNQGHSGRPTVTLQTIGHGPSNAPDVRAMPAGGAGIARQGEHIAPSDGGNLPGLVTPQRQVDDAGPDYPRTPGRFQSYAPDARPPGWEWSAPVPGSWR